MFKKIIPILLLLAIIINVMGIYPVFKLLQYQTRKERKYAIKNSVPTNQLHVIVVSTANENELKWVRPGKEFIYKENMYDIVRVQKIGDSTRYLCINDKEEKQLFAHLDEMTKKEMKNEKSPVKNSVKRLLKVLSQIKIPNNQIAFLAKDNYKHNTTYLLNLTKGFKGEILQPPKSRA